MKFLLVNQPDILRQRLESEHHEVAVASNYLAINAEMKRFVPDVVVSGVEFAPHVEKFGVKMFVTGMRGVEGVEVWWNGVKEMVVFKVEEWRGRLNEGLGKQDVVGSLIVPSKEKVGVKGRWKGVVGGWHFEVVELMRNVGAEIVGLVEGKEIYLIRGVAGKLLFWDESGEEVEVEGINGANLRHLSMVAKEKMAGRWFGEGDLGWVTARGETVRECRRRLQRTLRNLHTPALAYRTDIPKRRAAPSSSHVSTHSPTEVALNRGLDRQ